MPAAEACLVAYIPQGVYHPRISLAATAAARRERLRFQPGGEVEAEKAEGLSREQIEAEIVKVEEELEDVAQERRLTLGGTGIHIGAKEVERLRHEFERDEARLRSRLEELRQLI
jgi:hypothetical protein